MNNYLQGVIDSIMCLISEDTHNIFKPMMGNIEDLVTRLENRIEDLEAALKTSKKNMEALAKDFRLDIQDLSAKLDDVADDAEFYRNRTNMLYNQIDELRGKLQEANKELAGVTVAVRDLPSTSGDKRVSVCCCFVPDGSLSKIGAIKKVREILPVGLLEAKWAFEAKPLQGTFLVEVLNQLQDAIDANLFSGCISPPTVADFDGDKKPEDLLEDSPYLNMVK